MNVTDWPTRALAWLHRRSLVDVLSYVALLGTRRDAPELETGA